MLNTDEPTKLPLPFASSGTRTAIPTPSQIGITPGAASLTDGFPPLTRTALVSGGVPPSGADMNGILYMLSQETRWAAAGGQHPFDAAFATAIGGYPSGAIVQSLDKLGWWRCTANNNTDDPDAGGAGWVPHYYYGVAGQALSNVNVTLTALQYARTVIVLTGTLTGNVDVTFPGFSGFWIVINNTTGAFNITAKAVGGPTGVVLQRGANPLCHDGADMVYAVRDLPQYVTFQPTIQFGGGSVGQTYTSRDGNAIITGRKVEFWTFTQFSNKGSSTGSARLVLGALPNAAFNANVPVSIDLMTGLPGQPSGLVIAGSAIMQIRYRDIATGSEASSLTDANFTNTTALYTAGSFMLP